MLGVGQAVIEGTGQDSFAARSTPDDPEEYVCVDDVKEAAVVVGISD